MKAYTVSDTILIKMLYIHGLSDVIDSGKCYN